MDKEPREMTTPTRVVFLLYLATYVMRVRGWRYSPLAMPVMLTLLAVTGLTLQGNSFWPHPAILLILAAVLLVKWQWYRLREQHRT